MGGGESLSGSKVLLVDDNATNRELAALLLGTLYEVHLAASGEAGLALAREQLPDLILLDVMMDDLDGFEVCRRLKADRVTRDIPVIFLTAKNAVDDESRGFDVGAVDYVSKPFSPATLRARVKTHLELKRQRDELRELTETKNRFLAIAAHDLRGPLSSVSMLTEMFLEETRDLVPAEQRRSLERAVSATHQIMSLLDGLLDVSIMERGGKFAVELVRTSLWSLISERIQLLTPLTARKNLTVQTDLAAVPEFPLDANRVTQMFDNVFTNAIKYSPKGANIRVRLFEQDGHAHVEVTDEGPGLSPEDQVKAFGEFQTATPRPTGHESSTGLGLFIVKKVVEAHGGRVAIRCGPQGGTTLSFSLPIAR